MQIVALLDARREIELVPGGVVLFAVVVAGLKVMSTIKVELPHILAHCVPPDTAPGAVTDMVVNIAVVNQRAVPLIEVAPVLVYPDGVFDRIFLADKIINGYFS